MSKHLLSLFFLLSFSLMQARAQCPASERLKLLDIAPRALPDDPAYDYNLRIPHKNPKTKKWGYVHRSTKCLVIPHKYDLAGTFLMGHAFVGNIYADGDSLEVLLIDTFERIKHVERMLLPRLSNGIQWYNHAERFEDGYSTFQTNGHIKILSPDGQVLMDSLLSANERYFTTEYLGEGIILFESESGILLSNPAITRWTFFPDSLFRFIEFSLRGRFNSENNFFAMERKSDNKVGILNRHGELVVDYQWDMYPNVYLEGDTVSDLIFQNSKLDFFRHHSFPYHVSQDSIYLANRNGRSFWMHLDGRQLHAFPEGALAFDPSVSHWRKQACLNYAEPSHQGDTLTFALARLGTGEVLLRSKEYMVYLTDDLMGAMQPSPEAGPRDPLKTYMAYYQMPGMQEVEAPLCLKPKAWVVANSLIYEGKHYWLIRDRYSYKRMIVDSDCELKGNFFDSSYECIPGWKEEELYQRLGRYPGDTEPFIYAFSPDFKYFLSDFDIHSKADKPRVPYFDSDYPQGHLEDVPPINIFHFGWPAHLANRLEYFQYKNKRGKVIAEGYMDMLGQCYF